jgi:hypothetical protein
MVAQGVKPPPPAPSTLVTPPVPNRRSPAWAAKGKRALNARKQLVQAFISVTYRKGNGRKKPLFGHQCPRYSGTMKP